LLPNVDRKNGLMCQRLDRVPIAIAELSGFVQRGKHGAQKIGGHDRYPAGVWGDTRPNLSEDDQNWLSDFHGSLIVMAKGMIRKHPG
jgi:hypothetical protein